MELIAPIGLLALACVVLFVLDRQREDHEEQVRYRENWSWPPR